MILNEEQHLFIIKKLEKLEKLEDKVERLEAMVMLLGSKLKEAEHGE